MSKTLPVKAENGKPGKKHIIGHEGLKYIPYLATLFSFIAVLNLSGVLWIAAYGLFFVIYAPMLTQ